MNDAKPMTAKLPNQSGLLKMLLVVGGIGTILIGLGLVARLLSPQERQIGQATPLDAAVVTPKPATDTPPALALDAQRLQLWQQVQSSQQQLLTQAQTAADQLRLARAQRWQIHAAQQCNAAGAQRCPSPYSWLLDAYRDKAATLQRSLFAGRIATDSTTAIAFRSQVEELLDVGAALVLESGATPRPFVASAPLSDAIESLYQAAGNFESLRQQSALNAYEQELVKPPANLPNYANPPGEVELSTPLPDGAAYPLGEVDDAGP